MYNPQEILFRAYQKTETFDGALTLFRAMRYVHQTYPEWAVYMTLSAPKGGSR
jgi:hypothetical protein